MVTFSFRQEKVTKDFSKTRLSKLSVLFGYFFFSPRKSNNKTREEKSMNIEKIGTLRTDFPTKFGLPRQSGISSNIKARLIFEPEFRDENCIRGLDGFNYVCPLR